MVLKNNLHTIVYLKLGIKRISAVALVFVFRIFLSGAERRNGCEYEVDFFLSLL